MNQIYTTYEFSKRIKAFLGDKAPEPMKGEMGTIWIYDPECLDDGILQGVSLSAGDYPAYQLHDLLSKPFCEAVAEITDKNDPDEKHRKKIGRVIIAQELFAEYYKGGLPAVEEALVQMLKGE